MAGGSRESHLTIKLNRRTDVSVLLLLLTLIHTRFHSQLQFTVLTALVGSFDGIGVVCVCGGYVEFFPFGLLAKISSILPLQSSATDWKFSLAEAFASNLDATKWKKRANWTGWTSRIHVCPSFVHSAFTEVLDFHFWHGAGSSHAIYILDSILGIELRRSLLCLDWMSTWLESPLPLFTTCTHSTFSLTAHCLFDTCCVVTFATCLDAHCARGLDDSVHKNPLRTVCTTSTLAFATVLLFLRRDLSVTESSTDSTLVWLLCLLALLAAMLRHDALARVKGILLSLYCSFEWSAAPQDFVESVCATCTFVKSIFANLGSGRDSRNPLLPSSLLWHFALAILHDIFINLICIACKNSLASMSCLLATCHEKVGKNALCSQFIPSIPLNGLVSQH